MTEGLDQQIDAAEERLDQLGPGWDLGRAGDDWTASRRGTRQFTQTSTTLSGAVEAAKYIEDKLQRAGAAGPESAVPVQSGVASSQTYGRG